jgi:hypothetical protein
MVNMVCCRVPCPLVMHLPRADWLLLRAALSA